jgi:hypothetical protein
MGYQMVSLGFVGDVFGVMAEVDHRLTKVNTVDRLIRANQPGRKPGASQEGLNLRFPLRERLPRR